MSTGRVLINWRRVFPIKPAAVAASCWRRWMHYEQRANGRFWAHVFAFCQQQLAPTLYLYQRSCLSSWRNSSNSSWRWTPGDWEVLQQSNADRRQPTRSQVLHVDDHNTNAAASDVAMFIR